MIQKSAGSGSLDLEKIPALRRGTSQSPGEAILGRDEKSLLPAVTPRSSDLKGVKDVPAERHLYFFAATENRLI